MGKNWYHKNIDLFRRSKNSHWIGIYINIGKFFAFGLSVYINLFAGAIDWDFQFLCFSIHGHIYFRKLHLHRR
jgi:hypothetical protein